MAYKDLATVEVVEELSENATMLVEDGGKVKRRSLPNQGDTVVSFTTSKELDYPSITCNKTFEEFVELLNSEALSFVTCKDYSEQGTNIYFSPTVYKYDINDNVIPLYDKETEVHYISCGFNEIYQSFYYVSDGRIVRYQTDV